MSRISFIAFFIFLHSVSAAQFSQVSFDGTYKGKLGNKYAVTIYLSLRNEYAHGEYHYDRIGTPIPLHGTVTISGPNQYVVQLEEKTNPGDPEAVTALFKGTVNLVTGIYTGEWEHQTNGTKWAFTLTDQNPLPKIAFRTVSASCDTVLNFIPSETEESKSLGIGSTISLAWPYAISPGVNLKRLADSLTTLVEAAKGEQPDANWCRKQACDWVDENIRNVLVEGEDPWIPVSLDDTRNLYVHAAQGGILTMCWHFQGYYGGAHTLYGSTWFNWDLAAMKPLKFSDIFTQAGTDSLLVEFNFLTGRIPEKKPNIAELKNEYESLIEPAEAGLIIDHQGITFFYDVYVHTSWAEGPLEFTYNWKELKSWIKPGSPVRRLFE